MSSIWGMGYMWLPARMRGIATGLSVLVVGPLVSVAVSVSGESGSAAVAHSVKAASTTADVIETAGRDLKLRDPEMTNASAEMAAQSAPVTPPVILQTVTLAAKKSSHTAAPTSAPTVPAGNCSGSVQEIVVCAATQRGADPNIMLKIGECESGLNPADTPNGPYVGLFQFLPSTFYANAQRYLAGVPNPNIHDALTQAEIASAMVANGQGYEWGCYPGRR